MFEMAGLARDGVSIHVPQVFMSSIEQDYAQGTENLVAQFREMYAYDGGVEEPPRPEQVYNQMRERSGLIQSFSPDRRLREKHAAFGTTLGLAQPEVPPLVDIGGRYGYYNFSGEMVFQEWIFLQERSWIVSRSRELFTRMEHAGAVCLDLGTSALNKAARKIRKKDEEEALTLADKLLALGKFVAVGGGAVAAGVSLPPSLAIMFALSQGVFTLLDP